MGEENTSRSLKVATELFLRDGKSSSHIRGRISIPTAKATLLVFPPKDIGQCSQWPSAPQPLAFSPGLPCSGLGFFNICTTYKESGPQKFDGLYLIEPSGASCRYSLPMVHTGKVNARCPKNQQGVFPVSEAPHPAVTGPLAGEWSE